MNMSDFCEDFVLLLDSDQRRSLGVFSFFSIGEAL